jgi:hypothetical protein
MSTPTFTQAQIAKLQGYIDTAKADLDLGTEQGNQAALAAITQYYSSQTSVRGYATDARNVINNQGLFGVSANQDVIQAIGQTAWSNVEPKLMVNLANADLQTIVGNNGGVPTEAQIERRRACLRPAPPRPRPEVHRRRIRHRRVSPAAAQRAAVRSARRRLSPRSRSA